MRRIKLFEKYIEPKVDLIQKDDVPLIVDILYNAFGHIDDRDTIAQKLYPRMMNGLSLKLTVAGEIVGCYLLAPKSINTFLSDIQNDRLKDFKSHNTQIYLKDSVSDRGLQGIALSILPEWRSSGYGNLLKSWYDGDERFDYIWGVQDKKLGNIDDWTKSREIFAECPTHFATIRNLAGSRKLSETNKRS